MPSLRVIVEGREVHWRQLTSAVVVGRGDECDLRIAADRKMSRVHCVIRPSGTGWVIEDFGSHNGTLLRGYPVVQEELRDGDAVRAGDVTLEFLHRAAPSRPASKIERDAVAIGATGTPGPVVTWSAIAQSNARLPTLRRRNRSLWELANRGTAPGVPRRTRRQRTADLLRAKRRWARQNAGPQGLSALDAANIAALIHQRVSWPLGLGVAVLITAAIWYWRDYDGGPSRNDHRPLVHHHHSASAD